MILDTSFLIQLERELNRKIHGSAVKALETFLAQESLYITEVIAGELAAGASLAERSQWESFIRAYPILESGKEISWKYGEIVRFLMSQGTLIGANDLWIAAAALHYEMPVVTKNLKDFQRVPGLRVFAV